MQEFIEFLKQEMLLSLAWIGLLIALIVTMIKEKTAPYKIVTAAEATQAVNRDGGIFLDVRSREDFRSGHIAGAINLTGKEIKDNHLSDIETQKSAPIILVCKTGQTAIESAQALSKAGFENLSILKDGLISWNEANLPLVRGKKKKKSNEK